MLLKQLMLGTGSPSPGLTGGDALGAATVHTLLGTGSFSLLASDHGMRGKAEHPPGYLRWPHRQADQVSEISLREIGGGFPRHHRTPSSRAACHAIAMPSMMVQKMQNLKRVRGHCNAFYCAYLIDLGDMLLLVLMIALLKFGQWKLPIVWPAAEDMKGVNNHANSVEVHNLVPPWFY